MGVDQRVVQACVDTLLIRPSALMSDIDGTISLIAPTPESARLAEGAREALLALEDRLDVVAAISGRSVDSAESLIGLDHVLVIGNHGYEWQIDGVRSHVDGADRSSAAVGRALETIQAEMVARGLGEGLKVENKRFTGSIHYRLSPTPQEAGAALLDIADRVTMEAGLRASLGRMVVEVKPRMEVNKGTAIERLVNNYGLSSVIFLGDDVTDIDGFRMIARLRERSGMLGLAIAVAGPDAVPDVVANADMHVNSVAECVELLQAIADGLAEG